MERIDIRTTDNNGKGCVFDPSHGLNLRKIAGVKLAELKSGDYSNLLVFPQCLGKSRDLKSSSVICHLDSSDAPTLRTNNIMGFVGVGDTSLTIASRFAQADQRDYFLHYMLGKVLSINVVNMDTLSDPERVEDFLPYLFPAFLQKALVQGVLRRYRTFRRNDANVRGVIDVSRHIRQNIPFAGKIAYNTREHTADNEITQLVRHAIERLRSTMIGRAALSSSAETRDNVQVVEEHTPSYNRNERAKIIRANLKPTSHPYYTEWRPLQKLCLQILRSEKISFGEDKDKIHGLLFDGAWLWEEYLNVLLKSQGWKHPDNRRRMGGYRLFKDESHTVYPDFVYGENSDVPLIADAKYIPLENYVGQDGSEKATAIYYKTIAYMYRFASKHGFLLYPFDAETVAKKDMEINNTTGILTKLGFPVLRSSLSFTEYSEKMKNREHIYLHCLGATELALG